jgi:hypothetical protein
MVDGTKPRWSNDWRGFSFARIETIARLADKKIFTGSPLETAVAEALGRGWSVTPIFPRQHRTANSMKLDAVSAMQLATDPEHRNNEQNDEKNEAARFHRTIRSLHFERSLRVVKEL